MTLEIYCIKGEKPFVLEMTALREIKKNRVERIFVDFRSDYTFSGIEKFCREKQINFERIELENISLGEEDGKVYFLTDLRHDRITIRELFKGVPIYFIENNGTLSS